MLESAAPFLLDKVQMTASLQFFRHAAATLPVSSLGFEVAPNHMARFVLSNSNGAPDIGVSCGKTGQIARSAQDICSVFKLPESAVHQLEAAHETLTSPAMPLTWPQALWVMDQAEHAIWQRERHARHLFQVSRPNSMFNIMMDRLPDAARKQVSAEVCPRMLDHLHYATVIIRQLGSTITPRPICRMNAVLTKRI